MTIVLSDSGTSDPITDYGSLQTAVIAWAHREDDTRFAAHLPTFIRFAEARFNRKLRLRDMEQAYPETALSDGAADLPTGFLVFKELRYSGSPGYVLEPKSIQWVRNQATCADRPRYFAIANTQVICWPTAGSIKGTYYEEIPPLVSNDTNWLLTQHPDLYLYTVLDEAAIYIQDDSRLPVWSAKAAALLKSVQDQDSDRFAGGSLQVRAR